MRVTALYNPEAGAKTLTRPRLAALLERAGYDATYVSAKGDRWKEVLEDPGDLVIVAGGDGTTAKVAKRLAGRGTPLAILPGGTANNIARSLGLDGPFDKLIARWEDAMPVAVDLGLALAPWGEALFIEAAGLGVFPRLLELAAAREAMKPAERAKHGPFKHGVELMIELARSTRARHWNVALDGRDLSGDYIMLDAMNIQFIGGGLELAPAADPTDGMLDVIAVREAERASFVEYLRALEDDGEPPGDFTQRARRIEIECGEPFAHVDDKLWPEDDDARNSGDRAVPPGGTVVMSVQPGAIDVLL